MTDQAVNYRVERVLEVLRRAPEMRDVLTDALVLHAAHVDDPHWPGFTWTEVRASWQLIRMLLEHRVIHLEYESRSRKSFRLDDVDAVREAMRLDALAADVKPAARLPLPDDLFDVVVGLDRQLAILRAALEAERPVHTLVIGLPASAKSLILSELERLPGARRVLGSTTSKAGIVSYLLGEPDLQYLLIDELDEADGRELTSVFNGLMSEQRIERLQHGRTEQERRDVWVVATCNSTARLRAAQLSRFVRLQLPAYSDAEFRQVVLTVLVRREGADPELAAEIAEATARHTRDPRDAINVFRLCHGHRLRVAELVREVLA